MVALPPVLGSADLPEVELRAMGLDGEVYPIAESWCPVDVPITPLVRAEAIMAARSRRLIASGLTAAWIWGATPILLQPREMSADVRARARVRPGADVIVRERRLRDEDVVALGAVRVTTPSRTACDLARRYGSSTTVEALLRLDAAPTVLSAQT